MGNIAAEHSFLLTFKISSYLKILGVLRPIANMAGPGAAKILRRLVRWTYPSLVIYRQQKQLT
jgi:hypothetical protein